MRQRFSISRLLHNDKLMMMVSVIAAIVIWCMVVYGPGNVEERTITGVPIPVSLSDEISKTYDLYIVGTDKDVATVKVTGTRSDIGSLSAQDIEIAVDTSRITQPGTYPLQYRIVSFGDYDIKIVGDDTVTVVCDEFYEKNFEATIDISNVSVSDPQKHRLGDPFIVGDGSEGVGEKNVVRVKGPKSDVTRIDRIEATISANEVLMDQGATFEANLAAYDVNSQPVQSVQFLTASQNKVNVNVPVETHYSISLTEEMKLNNVPAGYVEKGELVSFSPEKLEFWSISTKFDKFMDKIRKDLVFDFDLLNRDNLSQQIVILDEENEENIDLVNGEEFIEVNFNVGNVVTRKISIPISEENLNVKNLPAGYRCMPTVKYLADVVLCGPSNVLYSIKPEDIVLVGDLAGNADATKVEVRLEIGNDKAWVCYSGDPQNPKHCFEIQVKVEKMPEMSVGPVKNTIP